MHRCKEWLVGVVQKLSSHNLIEGLSGLGSMMKNWEEDEIFWRVNENMDQYGHGWWTWTLPVILFIFTCHCLSYRRRCRPYFLSTSAAVSKKHALPSFRTSKIISDLDLKNLMEELEDNSSIWEDVIHKTCHSISYKAKCCKPKDGPLKYLSVTTFEDCSIEMLVNFYMDNHYRMQWDKTVVHHQQLQVDYTSATEIGCTIKKFPFLTPREYVLAWRLWQGKDGSFYCFSKECEHPLVPKDKRYVRVALFRSGWRIRKVPGRNACEIRMVHQEDAGLNVEMAKLAFTKRIWSYICKMDHALRKYSDRKSHHLSSKAGAILPIQKVPPEFEVKEDIISTVQQENLVLNTNHCLETCRSNLTKLRKLPSNKVIVNGLVILGGVICLSRGHSSLGTKVAMAYLLSKLTNRGFSMKMKGKHPTKEDLDT